MSKIKLDYEKLLKDQERDVLEAIDTHLNTVGTRALLRKEVQLLVLIAKRATEEAKEFIKYHRKD